MDNLNHTNPISGIKLFFLLVLVAIVFLVSSIIFYSRPQKGDIPSLSENVSQPFESVTLEAKAAYVYDVRNQTVLYAKNENTRLSLASLTKIMSALVAEEITPSFSIITVSGEALETLGDTGLFKDERWLLKDILDFSLLTSSNDGIRAVALSLGALSKTEASSEEILNDFVGAMNSKAQDLGLLNTYFWNETGLDESETKGGAYGTAHDMSMLLEYILLNKPELLSATRVVSTNFSSLDNFFHTATNTNSLANKIPGLIASKTGSTATAGGNLVLIFDPEIGRPIIVSLLGSTESRRFEDASTLINATMEYINNN